MRVLIDILHPAHVHFFRNFRQDMLERGHEVIVTSRIKDVTTDLLDLYGITHSVLSHQARGPAGLPWELLTRVQRLVRIISRAKPDVMTGIMGPAIALAGRATRTPAVVFYDTEFARASNSFTYPLASCVCTPDCYQEPVRGRHITYPGYHELAYLHPDRFEPDRSIAPELGVSDSERYSLVRFVSWAASHDIGEIAVPGDTKSAIVNHLRAAGRVFVSSESPLPPELEPLRLPVPVHRIHDVIAGASLVVGESATMASEAAVLGIPALFLSRTSRGYIDEQAARYRLVRHLPSATDPGRLREAIDELLATSASEWQKRRADMLADKVDVTEWMTGFFEARGWDQRG